MFLLHYYRDTMIYAMSAETTGLPVLLDILSDVVYRPVLEDLQVSAFYQLKLHLLEIRKTLKGK